MPPHNLQNTDVVPLKQFCDESLLKPELCLDCSLLDSWYSNTTQHIEISMVSISLQHSVGIIN